MVVDIFQMSTARAAQVLDMSSGGPNVTTPMPMLILSARRVAGVWDADYLFALRLLQQQFKVTTTNFGESMDILKRVSENLEQHQQYGVARMLMPNTTKFFCDTVSTIALLRSARVALACDAFRRETSRDPNSLPELVPNYIDAIPNDPFVNESLRYIVKTNGYAVYSVGPDQHDDGQKRAKEADKGEFYRHAGPQPPAKGFDISFEVSRRK